MINNYCCDLYGFAHKQSQCPVDDQKLTSDKDFASLMSLYV